MIFMPSNASSLARRPFRVAVVDDEPLARERLVRLLRELRCVVVAELTSGRSLLDWMQCNPRTDALFLESHMSGGGGLELLAEMHGPPPVIFVTAHAEHAVRAFDADVVDYVLKPVFKSRLERALARLEAKLRLACIQDADALMSMQSQSPGWGAPSEAWPPNPASARVRRSLLIEEPVHRIPVKVGDGKLLVELRKVTHFHVEDEIVWVWTGGKRFRTQWTSLTEVEQALCDPGLMRIQRNILARPSLVLGIRSLPGGRCKIRYLEGIELEVSRSATPTLRARIGIHR